MSEQNTVARHIIWSSQKYFGLATLLFVTTFIQTACISLASSHVPQYQAFHTALSYFMLNLPLTKSSQKRRNARHCRTPMKSIILILILRSKQYYRVVTVLTVYTRVCDNTSCKLFSADHDSLRIFYERWARKVAISCSESNGNTGDHDRGMLWQVWIMVHVWRVTYNIIGKK